MNICSKVLLISVCCCCSAAALADCEAQNRVEAIHANIYRDTLNLATANEIYAILKRHHKTRYVNLFICDPVQRSKSLKQDYHPPFSLQNLSCQGKENLVELFDNPYSIVPVYTYRLDQHNRLSCLAK